MNPSLDPSRSVQSALNLLEALLRDEHEAKVRQLDLVGAQERAVLANRSLELELAVRALEAELVRNIERERRRSELFTRFATAWTLDARALTVRSIAERALATHPASSARLHALRGTLRSASAELLQANRRLSALVRAHRQVVEDALACLCADGKVESLRRGGTLVDAEA